MELETTWPSLWHFSDFCLEVLGKIMEKLDNVSRSLGPPEYDTRRLNDTLHV
jgi:hypothetical protein